ncbi:EAL domain-containing protein [Thalassotalea fusca]
MYTYSHLLLRNMLLSALFSVIFTFFALFTVSKQLEENQLAHNVLLSALIVQLETKEDVASVFNKLKSSQQYAYISIKDKATGDTLQIMESPVNPLVSFLSPQVQALSPSTSEFKLTYRLDFTSDINFILSIVLIVVTLTLMFTFLAGKMSLTRYKKLIETIVRQITIDIKTLSIGKKIEKSRFTNELEFTELYEALNKIDDLLASFNDGKLELETAAYVEPVTQLENRSKFVQYFDSDEAPDFGVLTITRCSELQTINQIHGYNEGDQYVCNIADIIKSESAKYKSSNIFRLNSSDFATILPNVTIKEAERYAEELMARFNDYQQSASLDSVAYTGLVAFDRMKPLGEILALADTGISVAQTKQLNAWHAQKDIDILESSSAGYGNQNWRQEIDNVLENQRVTLLVQPIKPNDRNTRVYGEVLARFLNSANEMLPTASFIAMSEKLDRIVAVDKMIIEKTLNEITSKNLREQIFGINVNSRSIHDEQFLIWLERKLLRDPKRTAQLVFEITEKGLQQNIKSSRRFIDMIHRVGARITVERFGVGLTSFKFFRELKPDFIKMDSTYTRDIDEDKNNQYFLRLMVDLAHRLSITVLAESVESQEEKFMLDKLFIDGCQGYYLGKPEAI